MGLKVAVCSLSGTVVVSAEAGPGVAEALVAGPEGSGVRPHKDMASTYGSTRSIEAVAGVSGVLFQTGRTGTRVCWSVVQGARTGTDEGGVSPLSRVIELPYFRLTARPVRSS